MAAYEDDPGWRFLRRSREQMVADQSQPYDSKKNVWIPDAEEGFVAAEIKSTDKDGKLVVQLTGGPHSGAQKTIRKEDTQEMNPPKFEKTEDMSNLTFLNDASVLHNLRARYGAMLIYTYSGLFCVVINPYKRLPIYTDSVARMYIGKRRTEMPPHLFAVSDEAYRNMLQNHENQSMLITGESGAGKTENTKKVIAYFASVGASQQEGKSGGGKGGPTLEDQIIQTNPVLEAFGNAKTVRNNNSSRFGKFIRIHFSKAGRVASCDIEHYLLEKSRVIRQAPGERCYHIFYQIFSGNVPSLTKDLLLDRPPKEYYFISQAEIAIEGVDDKEEHKLTDDAFRILNFSEQEINQCYRLVSGIIHMGNMKFKQRPREEQAETDGTDEAEKAAKMYGVDMEEFLKALLKPRVKVGTEWVNKGQNQEQVAWSVGAMAKGLYTRLFHWLVQKCNITLESRGTPRDHFIGVLDIAGFEIFDFNSFEQLWINFVNEKLQQFFNHHMFVLEQEEYAREGIEWTFIDFGLDLQACIDLIEKPMGILAILDEECIVPKANDNTLSQKLNEQHLGKHPNFEKPKPPKGKQAEAHFAMRHYAGTVRYNVSSWLEKNKDPLNDTLVGVMKASEGNPLLPLLWSDYETQEEQLSKGKQEPGKKKGKAASFMTISMIYREGLQNLMHMLHQTHPHFVRCIIPNEKKQSGEIDAALVLNQLTCNGVLEGIRICRKGFPNRQPHADFVQRYTILAPEDAYSVKRTNDFKGTSTKMLQKLVNRGDLQPEQYRVGHTKVFFKAGIVAHIEDLRDQRLSQLITGFQAVYRWHLALIDKERRKKQMGALRMLQYNVKQWLHLRTWVWFRLYGRVRPLCRKGKEQMALDQLVEAKASTEESVRQEAEKAAKLAREAEAMAQQQRELQAELERWRGKCSDVQGKLDQITTVKQHLEREADKISSQLATEESRTNEFQQQRKRMEAENESIKRSITERQIALRKADHEKQSRENQLRTLAEETQKQEAQLARLVREKKQREEAQSKLQQECQQEEERSEQGRSQRQKLQHALEAAESDLDRERRQKAEADKARRKAEGEVRIARENLFELDKQLKDGESSLKRKEAEVFSLSVRCEEAQAQMAKAQRQAIELEARCKEIESELEQERQARSRADRGKSEIHGEMDELQDRLQEHVQATAAHIEVNKKRDAEVGRLRREIELLKVTFETQADQLRKKCSQGISELMEQIDSVQRLKSKAEKERASLQRQLEAAQNGFDDESKQRIEFEKHAKQLETQLQDLRLKTDEQSKALQDLGMNKTRLQSEAGEYQRQVDELEAQLAAIVNARTQHLMQLEEVKRQIADEERDKHSLKVLEKNVQHELDQLRESLEEEIASKSDLLRQLTREQAEGQQWRSRYENEGLVPAEELDELRRKQVAQIAELQNELNTVVARLHAAEKQRQRLGQEADAARSDADTLAQQAQQLEKRQRQQDKVVEDWRHQADDLQSELDAVQRECRVQSAEAHRLQIVQDQLTEQMEGLRRENRQLGQEVRDLGDHAAESQRLGADLEKTQRALELEKDELRRAVDEAEAALEAEEAKVSRTQVEVAQIRAEIEKRLQEKEEEFENIRRAHQRTIEGMQSELEKETKEKAEVIRIKKKLEGDLSELELALSHAQKANEEAQKNLKRYGDRVRELQAQIEEEQRKRADFQERFISCDKKLASVRKEQEDLQAALDAAQRYRKQLEGECIELAQANAEAEAELQAQSVAKHKLENELIGVRADLDEASSEVAKMLETGKRAAAEAARLAEELRIAQEKSQAAERQRRMIEASIKELQARIEEVELAALKGDAKMFAKLEQQLKNVESELENEQRRHADSKKNLSKAERRVLEIKFQSEEEHKNYQKLCELADKLQTKIRNQRKAIEEAEEVANVSLQKYRTVQAEVDSAEERANTAENSLARFKSRSQLIPGGASAVALATAPSSTHLGPPPMAKSESYAY